MEDTYTWDLDKEIIVEQYFECKNLQSVQLFRILRENLKEIEEILPLIEFILTRLDTVSNLIFEDRLWDAEIIMRSALETIVKLVYITTGSKEDYIKKCDEYWNVLEQLYSLKLSMQAKRNLEYFGKSEIHRVAYSPLQLSVEKEEEIKNKWSKAERQRIEQRWSFSEIVLYLSRLHKDKSLEAIITLTHSYRIASHVTHGDETGVSIIKERERRPIKDRNDANRGHFLRLLSDTYNLPYLIACQLVSYLNLDNDIKIFNGIHKELQVVEKLVEHYQSKIFEDPIYDIFKSNN